ncbi:hypothetical protein HMY34_02805 [Thiothrix subterranea]|uniref:hypothetical protein n=1 Tax=Thiothrix subterranea TaxID=2735563 RepID=UPI00192A7F1A|nr:hypothetical protein [Thiothrix subterranea]QQZ27767.1 hypothetical protein HMY34_02805 [Thiothrix subterranea]
MKKIQHLFLLIITLSLTACISGTPVKLELENVSAINIVEINKLVGNLRQNTPIRLPPGVSNQNKFIAVDFRTNVDLDDESQSGLGSHSFEWSRGCHYNRGGVSADWMPISLLYGALQKDAFHYTNFIVVDYEDSSSEDKRYAYNLINNPEDLCVRHRISEMFSGTRESNILLIPKQKIDDLF